MYLLLKYLKHKMSLLLMILLGFFYSSKSKIPVWPFVVLSFFGGAYVLIPYFVLWRPPAPPVEESELQRWPLNFLESKITAGVRRLLVTLEIRLERTSGPSVEVLLFLI